ncbi:MAG: xylulokinase [Propylenella sp.]
MFLGLDIGTTAVKSIIVDADQTVIADASVEHPTIRPEPGLSEQDPASWIAAVRECLAGLRAKAGVALSAVEAIGLSGQMHSPVLLDRNNEPLRPALLWNDSRGQEECAELTRAVPGVARLTGVVPMAGFTAAKLLWIRKHEPEAFAKIAHVMLAKDFVRLWLTGEVGSDVSDGAGTQLLDEARRCWAEPVLAAVGLSPEQMPRLHEGTAVAGRLRSSVAAQFGMRPGLPVAAGGGDAAAGALGLGCIDNDQGFISLGTGTVFVVVQDRYAPAPETMLHNFAHCIPDRWYQMAGMLNGASCLAWVLSLIGEADASAVLARVGERYRRPSQVVFLPYLTGERTPHNDPRARGVFFGLGLETDPSDLVQAVLEGVAFSIRDARERLRVAGCDCRAPGVTGGGARSELWARIIASVLGEPIVRYVGGQFGPALGAARLAMIASTGRSVQDVAVAPVVAQTIAPDAALAGAYDESFAKYTTLYQSVKELF